MILKTKANPKILAQCAVSLFSILTVLGMPKACAQDAPNVIPPSPEASALVKFADIPVSTYTGIPSINIPIYTIKHRDITVPISLGYHASGVRVDEEASWVGLGWALNAGGVLSRSIRGDDDLVNGYGSPGFGRPNYDIPNTDVMTSNCRVRFVSDDGDIVWQNFGPLLDDPSQENFEPDQFFYNFNGQSGKFIFDEVADDESSFKIHLFSQKKIDIEYEGERSWKITTADGYQYFFGNPTDWPMIDVDGKSYIEMNDQDINVTSWYLREIVSPTGATVRFEYQRGELTLGTPAYSMTKCEAIGGTVPCDDCVNIPLKISNKYKPVYLSKIDFGNGYIDFEHFLGREDLNGGRGLGAIKVYQKNNDELVKYISLEQSYAAAKMTPNYDNAPRFFKRLVLDKVVEHDPSDTTEKHSYELEYHDGQLPIKTSYAKDFWGYYNGKTTNSTLLPEYIKGKGYMPTEDKIPRFFYEGADRSVSEAHMKAQTLKKLIYPTGGYTEFDYEANDYSNFTARPYDLKEDAVSIDNLDGGTGLPVDDNFTAELPVTLPEIEGGKGYLELLVNMANLDYDNNCYDELGGISESVTAQYVAVQDINGTELKRYSYITQPCGTGPSYEGRFFIEDIAPGDYTVVVAIESLEYEAHVHVTVRWLESKEANKKLAGGLRVSKITNFDGTATTRTRTFKYGHDDATFGKTSYGKIMAEPIYGYIRSGAVTAQQSLSGEAGRYECFMRYASPTIPLINSGSIVAYSQVTELLGESGEYGKTVYEYQNDAPNVFDAYYHPYVPTAIPNTNGLLKAERHYNALGGKVREIENEYVPVNSDTIRGMQVFGRFLDCPYNVPSYEISVGVSGSACGLIGGICWNMRIEPYLIFSDWVQLRSTIETVYDQADPDNYASTTTDYFYENPDHLQPTSTVVTDSRGRQVVTEMKYAEDLPGELGSNLLIDKHMHSQVLRQTTSIVDGVVETPLSKAETHYKYDNGNVLPGHTLSWPSTSADPVRVDLGHDSFGNITQVLREGDIPVSYLWAYGNTYPVAKVVGADISTLKIVLTTGFVEGLGADTDQASIEGKLDDLRTQLESSDIAKDIQVTTYTYDPLVGMLSQTGPDGREVRYEYDSFNRLKTVRDHDGNILNMNEYHYR